MIEARQAISVEEKAIVKKAMPLHGSLKALCVYGYWYKDSCIGGVYLEEDYPNNLVMEFDSHHPSLIKAIGDSFSEMLKIKPQIIAKINILNERSIRISELLGFKKMYRENDSWVVQFNRENWRYQSRYPLTN
jgi:hypothetical protein